MHDLPVIGWDTETYPFSADVPAPRVVVNAFAPPPDWAPPWLEKGSKSLALLLRRAAEGAVRMAAHSAAYDIKCSIATHPELAPLFFAALEAGGLICTIVSYKLTLIAAGSDIPTERGAFSLNSLVQGVLKHPPMDKGEDSWRLRYGELDSVPLDRWPDEARAYALRDAVEVRDLARALPPWPDAPAQTAAAFALQVMADRGMVVDQKLVATERKRIAIETRALEGQLQAHGILRANGTMSNEAVRAYVLNAYNQAGEVAPLTPAGQVKTDRATLTRLNITDGPLFLLRQKKQLEKLESAYLSKFAAVGSYPLRPFVDVLKVTGRVSMSNPALQQIPRDGRIRECCVARPGFVFLSADLDTAELRSLGQACLDTVGFSRMAQAFRRDPHADLHLMLAADILRVPLAEAQARKKAGDPEVGAARQRAKAVNFGLPGGMGIDTFLRNQADQGASLPRDTAEQLKQVYLQTWSEMPAYFQYVTRAIDTCGYVTTRISQRPRGGCTFCEAANYGFQSRTADVAKMLAYLVVKESMIAQHSPLYGAHLVHFMHDEVIIEVREGVAHEAAARVHELVKEAGGKHLPDVPSESTPCLSRRWYKKASAVYDRDGRLIPWEPPQKEEA